MCVGCGASYTYEEAFAKGIVTLSYEDFKKRTAERKERASKPETWAEVKIDKHGLIWNTDGLVLINLFKCNYLVQRVNKWVQDEKNRAPIQSGLDARHGK